MHIVSNDFKQAIYAPERQVKARVTFDISDITAAGDVKEISTGQECIISDKQQLINKKREQSYNLATFETNRFRLDGSFSFADDTIINNKELGFCSNELCGAEGVFQMQPSLVFIFNSDHSSMGLTITFDVPNNEYATEFTVTAYDSNNNVVDTVDIVNNDLVQATPIGQLYKYRKIAVTIKKWSRPYRRARVVEVDFGIVRVYQDNNLIKMSLVEEMDPISSKLSSPEFKFTVDNVNREFNILNPQGFYKFLQQRQQVLAELGVNLGGTTEYVVLGNYLLWEWTSDEGALTASFTARTNLDLMSGFDYENLIPKQNYTLYQMAVDVFTLCGITNYSIDEGLMNLSTNALIKKNNCRNILQMIAIAGCANIFVTRDNTIVLKVSPISLVDSIDTVDMDNMYKEPQIQLDKVVKAVQVTYYSDLEVKQAIEVVNPGVTIGDILKLESNTLISTSQQALNIANWILRQKNYRAIYNVNWRGNPAHELNDIALIENSYGISKKAFITKNNLEYQGYLSAKTEARGLTEIVD